MEEQGQSPRRRTDVREPHVKAYFDTIKKKLFKAYGKKALDNVQVKEIGRKLIGAKFLGVYSVDKVPLSRNGFGVINTDLTGKPGTHWTAYMKRGKTIFIYDSFARPTAKILQPLHKKLKEKNIKIVNSDLSDSEQRGNSQVCGHLSLSWIYVAYKFGIENAIKI
jgi:hypothetical protein